MFDENLLSYEDNTTELDRMKGNIDAMSKSFRVQVIFIEKGDKYCIANGEEAYINRSYSIGNKDIQIGIYDDTELMLISFFHELSHCIYAYEQYETVYKFEEAVWKNTFMLMEECKIEVSVKSKNWADKQLKTYIP